MKLILLYFLIIINLFNNINFCYSTSNEPVLTQPKEWSNLNNNTGYSSADLIKVHIYPSHVEEFKLDIDPELSYKDININIASYDPKKQAKIKLEFDGEHRYLTGKTPWLVQVCGKESINFNISCINKKENHPCSLVILINSTQTIDLCSNGVDFNYAAIFNNWFDSLVKAGDVIYYILENFIPIKKENKKN